MSGKKIVILGCSSQQPTRKRNHGAYLVIWNNEGFLFDPGEGTQRQFIFADVAPTVVTRIFISHFHGDHCLGLGSMLMRLNLDRVKHQVHCYYPESGQKNFKYLRYGCVYHQNIEIIEHPVAKEGIVEERDGFTIEAYYLDHGLDNLGWRILEKDKIKFERSLLEKKGISGPDVKRIEKEGVITIRDKKVELKEVSWVKKGAIFGYIADTRPCKNAEKIAESATVVICESTYSEEYKKLAEEYRHMTAKEAASIAKKGGVKLLILTHFSARYQETDILEKEAKEIFPNVIMAEDLKHIDFPC